MAISTEAARPARNGGQAMVESLVVLLVACLLLFSLLQTAQSFAHREVMRHAAARAARARTVGFNSWMCEKVMRAAAIPASGRMLEPSDAGDFDGDLSEAVADKSGGALWDWAVKTPPGTARADFELARIPDYLASENNERAANILDYDGWPDISASGLGGRAGTPLGDSVSVEVRKRHPLSIFVAMLNDWVGIGPGGSDGPDELTLKGGFEMESHYPLYLDDRGW